MLCAFHSAVINNTSSYPWLHHRLSGRSLSRAISPPSARSTSWPKLRLSAHSAAYILRTSHSQCKQRLLPCLVESVFWAFEHFYDQITHIVSLGIAAGSGEGVCPSLSAIRGWTLVCIQIWQNNAKRQKREDVTEGSIRRKWPWLHLTQTGT